MYCLTSKEVSSEHIPETIYSLFLDLSQFWDIHFAPTRGSLCENETHTEENVAIGEGVGERDKENILMVSLEVLNKTPQN